MSILFTVEKHRNPERLDGEIEYPLLNRSTKYEHEVVEKNLIPHLLILFHPISLLLISIKLNGNVISHFVIKINKRNENKNEFLTSNLFLEIGSITPLEMDFTIDAIIQRSILKPRICSERCRRRTIRLCACLVQCEMQLRLVFIVKKLCHWLGSYMQANYDNLAYDINNLLLYFNDTCTANDRFSFPCGMWHRLRKNKYRARQQRPVILAEL